MLPDFYWYDFFLILWFVIATAMAFVRGYKRTLGMLIASNCSFAFYAFMLGQFVATAIPLIAATGAIIQLIMPLSAGLRVVVIRNTIAIISACAACVLLYDSAVDILPCLGFIILRIGEAQQVGRIIRISFLAAAICWTLFAILQGLYLLVFLEIIMISVYVYKFWTDHRARRFQILPDI